MEIRIKWKEVSPYLLFIIVMFGYHLFMHTQKMDDVAIYGDLLDYSPLLPWLKFRYQTWTSRVIIDGLIVLFVEWNPWFWKIFNLGCWVLFIHSLIIITDCEESISIKYIIVFLTLSYPIFTMGSAGWCATQLNYLWPMALGTFGLTTITFTSKNVLKWYHWILYLTATVFASNQEQMCAFILAVLATHFAVSIIFSKKLPDFSSLKFVQLLLAATQLVSVLTCKGNQERKLIEIERWMPDYPLLSFRDKIYIGFTDTIERVAFHKSNPIFLIFTIILFIMVLIKTQNLLLRVLVFFLPLTVALEVFILNIGHKNIPLQLFIVTIIIFCFVILCDNMREFLTYGVVLGSGFISRVAVGYSPSVYVSGDRTCLFLYGTIIFTIVKLLYDIKDENPKLIYCITGMTGTVAFICVLKNYIEFFSRTFYQ